MNPLDLSILLNVPELKSRDRENKNLWKILNGKYLNN